MAISYDAVGSGGVGATNPLTFSDTTPGDANYSLIWVEYTGSVASPTVSASYGSTSATLTGTPAVINSTTNMFLACFKVAWPSGPPSGSQTVSFTYSGGTLSNCAMDVIHYKGVSSVGTPITVTNQSGNCSMSASSTVASNIYAQGFGYRASATGNTFTLYNQTQRAINPASTTAPNSPPLVFGDAFGNGGTLTFTATRSVTTNPYGGMIVPLIGIQGVAPTAISSAEAFGSTTVILGAKVLPTGIGSTQSFGTATVSSHDSVLPTGIASAQAFGTAVVGRGAVTASPSGIASAQAFGTAVITTAGSTITPTGIASAGAFGTASVAPGAVSATPTGISSAQAFGSPTVGRGAVNASPTGIATAGAFGTPVIAPGAVGVTASGISSAQAFGTAAVSPGVAGITPTGIAPADAFGTTTVTEPDGTQSVTATGIASGQAFGTPTIGRGAVSLSPAGITSSEALGTLVLKIYIAPDGTVSAEEFGDAGVSVGPVTIAPTGLASGEHFGSQTIIRGQKISPVGIPGQLGSLSFGQPRIASTVQPIAIASDEEFGSLEIGHSIPTIRPTGIASAGAFGTAVIAGGSVITLPVERTYVVPADDRVTIITGNRVTKVTGNPRTF